MVLCSHHSTDLALRLVIRYQNSGQARTLGTSGTLLSRPTPIVLRERELNNRRISWGRCTLLALCKVPRVPLDWSNAVFFK